MRIAFHFDAGRFGGSYGFPVTVLLFRRLLEYIPAQQRDLFIRRGNLLTWEFVRSADDAGNIAHQILTSSREIWSTLSAGALAAALLDLRVWVLVVEGLTASGAKCVDARLA